MLLAGDIGGTTVRLALVSPERGPRSFVAEQEFRSAQFHGLAEAVSAFLASAGGAPTAACFSVAGPVVAGRTHLTNLQWDIDASALASALGLGRVDLLNDLACMAHAVPHLTPSEVEVVNDGESVEAAPIAVIAPGTGLGEAFLVWTGDRYVACASEGGHADFAPRTPLQAELLAFVAARREHVSYERVCSGSGLPEIYEFLCSRAPAAESAALRTALDAAADHSPLIVDAGLHRSSDHPLAAETLRLFVEILGAEAGNLALKVLATGGVYLAGGMPGRLGPLLRDGTFMRAFTAKGRFAALLEKTPVRVVTINAALLGAAIWGLEQRPGAVA